MQIYRYASRTYPGFNYGAYPGSNYNAIQHRVWMIANLSEMVKELVGAVQLEARVAKGSAGRFTVTVPVEVLPRMSVARNSYVPAGRLKRHSLTV